MMFYSSLSMTQSGWIEVICFCVLHEKATKGQPVVMEQLAELSEL